MKQTLMGARVCDMEYSMRLVRSGAPVTDADKGTKKLEIERN
jgi:hypothetical protein